MNNLSPDDESLLKRPLYKDISNNIDTSIKINSSNDKNIKVSPRKDLNKDRVNQILSPEAIREFQELHLNKFGTEISAEEAEIDLIKLMRLIVLTQPELHKAKKKGTVYVNQNLL